MSRHSERLILPPGGTPPRRPGGAPRAASSARPAPTSEVPAGASAPGFDPGRWSQLARAVALAPDAPVVVALSGGADSVYLLHAVAAARPRPRILAVHVDHGLRSDEGRADAEFCLRLCAALGIPFVRRSIRLEPGPPSLEARARAERYRVLCEEARAHGIRTVLTGHHADDALETLLMRWLRGTSLHGLTGLRPRLELGPAREGPGRPADERLASERLANEHLATEGGGIDVVRPLLAMRREEVRRALRDRELAWREDSSNASAEFTRNRVRHDLLPAIEAACGPEAVDNLRAFGAAVETLEERCAALTSPLSWSPPVHAAARRGARDVDLGGTIARAALSGLVAPLRRRALWRLLAEGTGRAPSNHVLDLVLADLESGASKRHTLPGAWSLLLRSDRLHLEPPAGREVAPLDRAGPSAEQLALPFGSHGRTHEPLRLRLRVPGSVSLPDGRAITAEIVRMPGGSDVPRSALEVELDPADVCAPGTADRATLTVRWPLPGDRFHPFGAPGGKRLSRFLADAGVPREDRGRVPLVFAGDELIWVAGIRPCESRRLRPGTPIRLRLSLLHPTARASLEPRREPLFEPAAVRIR